MNNSIDDNHSDNNCNTDSPISDMPDQTTNDSRHNTKDKTSNNDSKDPHVSTTQKECHIPLVSFEDLARMACSYREHPRRLYTFELNGTRVAATSINLANTLVAMYAPLPDTSAKYVTYTVDNGHESCGVSKIASNASSNAPLIHLKSNIVNLEIAHTKDEIPDVFAPVELCDLASLARLTFDPEFPDVPELALYAVPFPDSSLWALGYLLVYDMDDSHYVFYHVVCDSQPSTSFLRYRHDADAPPEFTDRVEHGYLYMPIIKVKESHPMFGLCG